MDSSIEGKTGVDFDAYKNMVRVFRMSHFVYTNLSTLLTLSNRQSSPGMGEMIKHGLTEDKKYYQRFRDSREGIGARDLMLHQKAVLEGNHIKKQVVEMNLTE